MIVGNPMMLGGGVSAAVDPYWASVEWLVQPRAGDGGVIDRGPGGRTPIVSGTIPIVAAASGFGAAYDFVPANGPQIRFPGISALGSGAYTYEAIVSLDVNNQFQGIISNESASSIDGNRINTDSGSNELRFSCASGGSGGAIATGPEIHVALQRDSSGNTRLFAAGAQLGATVVDTVSYANTDWVVGTYRFAPQYFLDGKIVAARLTRGVARYGASFPPPTRFPETGG